MNRKQAESTQCKQEELIIAAVVVSHNRRAEIEVTVTRLLAEAIDHIIVVDNCSKDGTREYLEKIQDQRLRIQLTKENLGGAGGFELGMRIAVSEYDPDWIVLMDDDARPISGTLAEFRQLDTAKWEALAAAVFMPDGRICEINRPWLNPFSTAKAFFRTAMGGGRMGFHISDSSYGSSGIQPVDGASFVGLFLSRRAIALVGYPDGSLFIYGDDVLYTIALTRAGGHIGFAPDLVFEHNFTSIFDGEKRMRPVWKTYYHHRNLLYVYRAIAGWVFWPLLLFVLPKWLLKAKNYENERRAYQKLTWLAVRHGIGGRKTAKVIDHASVVSAFLGPNSSEKTDPDHKQHLM